MKKKVVRRNYWAHEAYLQVTWHVKSPSNCINSSSGINAVDLIGSF